MNGENAYMFCSKCGNQLSDTASFCEKCGTPVGSGSVTHTQDDGQEPQKGKTFSSPENTSTDEDKKSETEPKKREIVNITPLIIKETIVGIISLISGIACIMHLGTWINCIVAILGYYTTIGGKIGIVIAILFLWGRTVRSIINIAKLRLGIASHNDLTMNFEDWCWVIIPFIVFAVGSFLGGDPYIRGQRAIACVKSEMSVKDEEDEKTLEELKKHFTGIEWDSEEMDENIHHVMITGYWTDLGEKITIIFITTESEDRYEVQLKDIIKTNGGEFDDSELLILWGMMSDILSGDFSAEDDDSSVSPYSGESTFDQVNPETNQEYDISPDTMPATEADSSVDSNEYEGQWLNATDETSVMQFKKASTGNAYIVSYSKSFGANDWSLFNCTAMYDKDENDYFYTHGSWSDYTINENGEEEKENVVYSQRGRFHIDSNGELVWLEEDPESELHFIKIE